MTRNLIAVTSCPRPDGVSYLEQTLASLNVPVTVFYDRDRVGNRANTWRVLKAGKDYERVLLFQDDVLLAAGTLEWMATIEIPDDVGLVNFHSLNGDDFAWDVPPEGVHKFPVHRCGGWGLMGLQAVVIPGHVAGWLAEQDYTACPKPGANHDDYAIGWLLSRSPWPNKLVVAPSPITHIGEVSAAHEDERRLTGAPMPRAGMVL